MKNISFDNPYLLLVFIPLLAVIIIPFAIAVRKDNRNKSVITSLVLHIVIAVLVTLGIAGTAVTLTMTETQVIVVADVSYSANRNLDTVDAYIKNVEKSMPAKSKLGVVCFGKDYGLLTDIGGELKSVKSARIDDSATNISDALDYASTLFDEGVIKRIVLITDGKQTDKDATARLINSVENIYAKNIYIDAIYLDDNIAEGTHEVQLSGVECVQSTYLNHESVADVLIQSNVDGERAMLSLYQKGEDGVYRKISDRTVILSRGYNIENYDMPTSAAGEFDYKLVVSCDSDTSKYNNEYLFTQKVSDELNVLLITSSSANLDKVRALYGESASIDPYIIEGRNRAVPYTVEELCMYDEIMLCDIDVRTLDNVASFVNSLETVVSMFGKSLVTVGDTNIQNKSDDMLKALEDMLPVRFGNGDQDRRIVGIVMDASRSMETLQHLAMAKAAAKQLVRLLNKNDYVMVIAFSGEVLVPQTPITADNKEQIEAAIDAIEARQGTLIGAGIREAAHWMLDETFSDIDDKQLYVISDGKSYSLGADDYATITSDMHSTGVVTSVIHTLRSDSDHEGESTMKTIAECGGGKYYAAPTLDKLEQLMLSDVADDFTETVLEQSARVKINLRTDRVLRDIGELPNVDGYIYGKAKSSASAVLFAEHVKDNGTVKDVPLYSYWEYGNGRVATLSTKLEWLSLWQDGDGAAFLDNMLTTNIPREKINYPYTVNVDYDGIYSNVEIIPAQVRSDATVTVRITMPDGGIVEEKLTFDSEKYYYSFETPELGKHKIDITYSFGEMTYEAQSFINLSYSPEYDSFAAFDASSLYESIRGRGSVSEDGSIKLENDPRRVATYTLDFTVPFLVAAIVLYIIDIIVRKIKWADIRALFRGKAERGGA